MTTTRRIERLWAGKEFQRLLAELLAGRSEDFARVRTDTDARLAAAALAVVRLDEFNQSHAPFYADLVRVLLASQQKDGSWSDPMTTALSLRALRCGRGNGVAVDRAVEALSNLQKPDGSFPAEPLRRMPADAFVTAFVLYEVGDREGSGGVLRTDDGLAWLERSVSSFDPATQTLCDRLKVRFGPRTSTRGRGELILTWS